MKTFRRRSGQIDRFGQNLNWYENRTNVPGYVALATNLRLLGLRIYAHAWVNAHSADDEFPDLTPAFTERRIEVDYSFGLRNVRARLSWHYGDGK